MICTTTRYVSSAHTLLPATSCTVLVRMVNSDHDSYGCDIILVLVVIHVPIAIIICISLSVIWWCGGGELGGAAP